MADYQLIVIGAGPGGYEAALRAAQQVDLRGLEKRLDAGGELL